MRNAKLGGGGVGEGTCKRYSDAQVSKGCSTLGCQSLVSNDVPCSWNMHYLYYFNGLTLFGRISEADRT